MEALLYYNGFRVIYRYGNWDGNPLGKIVVDEAIHDGPQIITRRGVAVAIVLSYHQYRQMIVSQKKLSTFFRESPLVGVELDLSRDASSSRISF